VLEDLNTGFKRGRQKIEKSVYQKFEVALAKKLNFLVDKTAQSGEVGSVTRALQLTPPVNNYQDIEKKKQVGIMLYTRANYTSQTDPLTGWRKSIYLKTGSEESIKAQILSHFSDIYFDGKDYFFEYEDTVLKKWKLYSGIHGTSLERFRGVRGKDKNEWQIKQIDIVEILDEVFKNCDKNRSLLSQIGDEGIPLAKTASDHTAWESLRFAIELIQQIRNTGLTEQDNDFLLSPVRNENGVHFDSREYLVKEQQGEKVSLPTSGDANGAFNIARKGIIMNAHIKHWIDSGKPKHKDKGSDLNLFVSDEEWDLYLQDKQKWKESIPHFASKKSFEDEKKKH
jgi:CRISPR-associated protein Cpf1